LQLACERVAKQATTMRIKIAKLRHLLRQRLIGNVLRRPDLAMGMRIAGAHHRAAIFKNLNVIDFRTVA